MMNPLGQVNKRHAGERTQAQMVIVALGFFLLGAGASAWWFSRNPSGHGSSQTDWTSALLSSAPSAPGPRAAAPADLAALDAVKRLIPNLESAPIEEGTRILRAAALAEFEQTARQLQARQEKAEQTFIEGQNTRSDDQQRMAIKQLQDLEADRADRLKQIAANAQARIDTLQQIKGAAR